MRIVDNNMCNSGQLNSLLLPCTLGKTARNITLKEKEKFKILDEIRKLGEQWEMISLTLKQKTFAFKNFKGL